MNVNFSQIAADRSKMPGEYLSRKIIFDMDQSLIVI